MEPSSHAAGASRPGAETPPVTAPVERAKAYLARRLDEPLDLEAVARAAHCSRFHLCRLFKRETGTTLSRYLHTQRLDEALARLADNRTRLSDLAADLGYASHSHFTAAFRREFGRTPSELRSARPSADPRPDTRPRRSVAADPLPCGPARHPERARPPAAGVSGRR